MSEPTNHMARAEALLADAATHLEEAEHVYQLGKDGLSALSRRRAETLIAAAHVHAVLALVPQPAEAAADVEPPQQSAPLTPGTRVAWAPWMGSDGRSVEGVIVDLADLSSETLEYDLPEDRVDGRATAWVRWDGGGVAEYLVDYLQVIPDA